MNIGSTLYKECLSAYYNINISLYRFVSFFFLVGVIWILIGTWILKNVISKFSVIKIQTDIDNNIYILVM